MVPAMNFSAPGQPVAPTHPDALASVLLQCSPDCVKLLDHDGKVTFFNESGLCAMEIDDFAQVRGTYWPELWPSEARRLLEDAIAEARAGRTGTFVAACPTAKGTPKWWDVTVTAVPSEDRRDSFVVVSRDITARREADKAERSAHRRLRDILGASSDVLWDIDLATDHVWWGEGMRSVFGYGPDQIGPGTQWCHDHIHPDDRARVVASMHDAVANGDVVWEGQFRYRRADNSYANVLDRGAIIRDSDGRALRFLGIMQDISALTESANRNELLARELAHRVNNTLAVVTGIFQLTRKSSTDLESFAEAFGKRILAMANANRLLVRGTQGAVDLVELAQQQLAPFMTGGQVTISGPTVMLPFGLTQPIALALNELATNAIKHGALSIPGGKVSLTWTLSGIECAQRLGLRWQEENGPPVRAPARRGLGSQLIERGIPAAVVRQSFDPGGLRCEIDAPLSGQ